ncbi:MAG: ABC transporter ATP-binding protein [Candidatus Izemoplasmatales bacterium]|nr:ABC transporter ATP-binding protein [Candidatus Izemoplasmatales bacterium]MDD5293519.1 ABC transporter ATP-binding protein [Candidatus Izemoplasmatales bacterium]
MEILSVDRLTKNFKTFSLNEVSFALDQGFIMGFIGRNGAGKTTTIKSMLRLVYPRSGKVMMFGQDYQENEFALKQKLGLVLGGINFYPKKKLSSILAVTKRFYATWDDDVCAQLMQKFSLDVNKQVDELSAGMRVKFSLLLALSHHAQLLILDEPTSGLDPVSRDEVLLLFQDLVENGDISILFSTHITSDLEKCADYITYIKNGSIIATSEKDTFIDTYRLVKGPKDRLLPDLNAKLIGPRIHKFGFEGLIKTEDLDGISDVEVSQTNLETIMIHIERT